MIKWNNEIVKYSLLLSGKSLDIEEIEKCLKDGIKVLWFGSKEEEKLLIDMFPKYINDSFLCAFVSSDDIELTVVDGKTISEDHTKLARLEREDPRFNLKQYEIEHDGDEPFVVVQAGAGSGKTFVMINRLLYLLHTRDDFRFSDVAMMTFTNEATDSMRRKLIEMLNKKLLDTGNVKYLYWIEDVSQITISTIHSFFRRVIAEVGPLLGYGTNLKMSNMAMEKKRILREIMDEQYGLRKEKVQSVLGLSVVDLEGLAKEFWKKIENNGMSGPEVFSMDWGNTSDRSATNIQESLRNIFKEVEERYNAQKLESNAIALGDIIHEFSRVVEHPKMKEYITSRYKYLFFDEFQDSDDVQIKTIAALDKVYDGNLFVVGDVKQSIYRFRGATDSAFRRLKYDLDDIGKTYSLTKNYRTSREILQVLDEIFRIWADKGYLKYEYTGRNNDVLIPQVKEPGVYKQIKVNNKKDLKNKFIKLINELEKELGDQKKSIMVLARTNWQLQTVKGWCEEAGKACIIRENGGFFKGPAVMEFCSLIEALLYHSEPLYLFNLLNTAYCHKPIDIETLASCSEDPKRTLSYLKGLIGEELEWEKRLDDLRNRPVMAVICEMIAEIKPSIKYGAIQKHRYMMENYDEEESTKQAILDAEQYEADLQKLLQMLSDSFLDEFSTLPDICGYVRTRINTDEDEESAEVGAVNDMNCIQGSTVHGAKGLEFDYVLLPFMYSPFDKSDRTEILIDKNGKKVGWQYKNKSGWIYHNDAYAILRRDEEREVIGDETRLLYVAMTRAKEGLFCFTWWMRNNGVAKTWSDLLPEAYDDANYL